MTVAVPLTVPGDEPGLPGRMSGPARRGSGLSLGGLEFGWSAPGHAIGCPSETCSGLAIGCPSETCSGLVLGVPELGCFQPAVGAPASAEFQADPWLWMVVDGLSSAAVGQPEGQASSVGCGLPAPAPY